jgi:8-oxo-dGTP pyrophosphatase MutT (NUDIX family)
MAQPEHPLHPPCPPFEYTKYLVDDYDIPYESHIANQPEANFRYKYVANGAFVIEPHPIPPSSATDSTVTTSIQKILLIQRAAHDSMPGQWEIPGGACDPEDPSVLYSVARELWEEAGLKATRIGPLVGGTDHIFLTRSGNLVCKFSFVVDVEKKLSHDGSVEPLQVKLDPNEHQAYVWATEHEVQAGRVGAVELRFTNQQTRDGVLEAFRVKKELDQAASTG